MRLLVSREYAEIPSECSFVEPVFYDGSWQDLAGAIRFAKGKGGTIVVPQTFGIDFPIERRHHSFQLDQWDRAGLLHQWGKLPLELPRKSPEGWKLNPKWVLNHFRWDTDLDKPFILFADYSESSPFPHKEEVYTALTREFQDHQIVRLSSIRTPRLLDLLPLYDAAALIVACETMHLHLSAASRTPVIAFATDIPSRWHGSAYHPRMALHVRYGDVLNRLPEILNVARRRVNKLSGVVMEKTETRHANGYNMSILLNAGNLLKTYRYHPDPKSWRTVMAIWSNGETKPIFPPEKYSQHSIEDGRLFWYQGQPHLSCTICRSRKGSDRTDPCITGFGRLNFGAGGWRLEDWTEPLYGKNNWTDQEKNWVFFEHEGELFFIYRCEPQQIVCQMGKGNLIKKVWKSTQPGCSFGEIRGGTRPVPFRGKLLRFFHTNQRNPKSDQWWSYHTGALVMEPTPPFRILSVSKCPVISGNELYTPKHKFWKPRVCIPYGIEPIAADAWMVSFGLNDSECGLASITAGQCNL